MEIKLKTFADILQATKEVKVDEKVTWNHAEVAIQDVFNDLKSSGYNVKKSGNNGLKIIHDNGCVGSVVFDPSLKESVDDIDEASEAGRAWEGRLKNIDSLLSWMYDKDILTKAEKAKKDSLFYSYYRYYNDGDLPRGFGGYASKDGTVSGFAKQRLEKELEAQLEEFIRKILSKYLGKIDKQEFRYDKHISELNDIKDVADRKDVFSLTNYWIKNSNDERLTQLIKDLEDDYKHVRKIFDDFVEKENLGNFKNIDFSYALDKLKAQKVKIPENIEKAWKNMQSQMIEISSFTQNLITGIKKLKDLRALNNAD